MQKKEKFKIIVLVFVTVFLGVIAFAGFLYNKPHTNVTKTKPEIILTAQVLLNDFENNEMTANLKYLEKIIEVSGVIADCSMNKNNKGVVILECGSIGTVMCHLSEDGTKKMSILKKGEKISIKGICTGYLMDVILVKCVITNK